MKTPINNGLLQSDIDFAGFTALNFSIPAPAFRKFDVKTYGAIGNGMADDTVAIQAALTAIPATGGVLYFPAGEYKYTGATLTLSRPTTVEGDGGSVGVTVGGHSTGGWSNAVSVIQFNSETQSLFSVEANGCTFKNIMLFNSYDVVPSAGAGITVAALGYFTNFTDITIQNFYIGIDVQTGGISRFDNCFILAPVLYGIKLRNNASPDGGDHCISNCNFYNSEARSATSAIRIESGGGPKIINCKVNSIGWPAFNFVNGIDVALVNNVNTSDLLIANCSIEAFSGTGIKIRTGDTASLWGNIFITGNQFFGAGGIGIDVSPTNSGDCQGVIVTANYGKNNGSGSPFTYFQNCTDLVLVGNGQYGFSSLVGFGTGNSFGRSQTIPPGGTAGQSLKKLSGDDYDVGWA